nr:MAG TPA: hypothetical protein [Caudoviricetes sp.]
MKTVQELRIGKIYLMQCGTKMRIRQQKKSAHYCE